jgi:uncharacterized heparinase superfamily protein
MSLKDLPRLARTVAHLRPSQIFWRGRYALERRFPIRPAPRPTVSQPAALPSDSLAQAKSEDCARVIGDRTEANELAILERLSQGRFLHLNEERELGRPPDWLLGSREHGRLWTVTLHYHRWAWELAMTAAGQGPRAVRAHDLFRELVGDWIERCDISRPGARDLAWNSYAIATRLEWWTLAALQLFTEWNRYPQFESAFYESYRRQANHLFHNIEWDLRGNHLVRDAVGLAWATRLSLYDTDRTRDGYQRLAMRLADEQAGEQVLPDGGHFERSPMYHRHVMHDFGMLSQMSVDAAVRDRLKSVVTRMEEFDAWLRHPDGGLVPFNDAALDEEPPPLDTVPPQPTNAPRGGRYFADTGLAVWRGAKWAIFFDVGPLGPDYQPGHGHADNLTLECSYDCQRLFVDPGTHSYDRDERRAYDRSTAAHNTVCVDDTDSSEVWHIFRVGRRARPIDVQVTADETHFDASAAHDGYRHLGGVIHRRRVQLINDETLTISDRIEGTGPHKLAGGWLLAPDWTAVPAEGGWILQHARHCLRAQLLGPSHLQLSLENRPWHPRFGIEIPTTRLVWCYAGALPFELKTSIAVQTE